MPEPADILPRFNWDNLGEPIRPKKLQSIQMILLGCFEIGVSAQIRFQGFLDCWSRVSKGGMADPRAGKIGETTKLKLSGAGLSSANNSQ